jgi:hypothetical protein
MAIEDTVGFEALPYVVGALLIILALLAGVAYYFLH